MTVGRPARRRRRPEEAERAILAAARSFLERNAFREMTVERVMARTGLSRPAFYAYFRDRYELVTRVLEGIGGLLFAVDRRWLAGAEESREEARLILADALRRGAETFARYGPVLRAISEAASQDERLEEVYRYGLIERLICSVAERIERDRERGLTAKGVDPEEAARALVLDAFGKPEARPSREKTEAVVGTLVAVWASTLYGPEP